MGAPPWTETTHPVQRGAERSFPATSFQREGSVSFPTTRPRVLCTREQALTPVSSTSTCVPGKLHRQVFTSTTLHTRNRRTDRESLEDCTG